MACEAMQSPVEPQVRYKVADAFLACPAFQQPASMASPGGVELTAGSLEMHLHKVTVVYTIAGPWFVQL